MRIPKGRTVAALALLGASVLAGQTPANWTKQSPATSPPARFAHAMAYDSAHGQVVLFGGEAANGAVFNDTWVWDGSNWTQKFPKTSPPAREAHAMAYDSAHGQVVLFGGNNLIGVIGSGAYYNDTWVWDGSNWTKLSPQASPPARFAHAMAYDFAREQVVLFGGSNANLLQDTWVWDGVNWTQKSPHTQPAGRNSHAMAYDSSHSQVVMFGGNGNGTFLSDTWVWDGSNWTNQTLQNGPAAREFPAMAYDSAHGKVVLFGGLFLSIFMNFSEFNDTWLWDGSTWSKQSPQTTPSGRDSHAMAYDSAHDMTVLFGGAFSQSALGDTWTWNGGSPATLAPSISGVVSASGFGGFSSAAPGSWVEIYGSNLAPDTRSWTSADFTGNNAPTALDGVSVTIGGQSAFVDYISSSQVNAQLPSNLATGAALPVAVTRGTITSPPVNLMINPVAPGLLAPASFQAGSNQYVVAQLPGGAYVLPAGTIGGLNSRPAKPGETIVIYGIGFGTVVPNIPAGQIASGFNQLSAPLQILFAQTPAQAVSYAGLAPGLVGLYQFNVIVPAVADSDLAPLTFTLNGVPGVQTLFTAVHQ